jgi:hypothetical protein
MTDSVFDKVKKLFKLDSAGTWVEFTSIPDFGQHDLSEPIRVSVDRNGNPWVLYESGISQYFDGHFWKTRVGPLNEIAIGFTGKMAAINIFGEVLIINDFNADERIELKNATQASTGPLMRN